MAPLTNKRRSARLHNKPNAERNDITSHGAPDLALFERRTAAMRERVSRLFRAAQSGTTSELLAHAFDEIQLALEELQLAEDALRANSQQRLTTSDSLDTERRYYIELFEQAPVGYILTNTEGTIRQANQHAAALFKTPARQLIGRSLALFVPEGSRRAFRARMAQLCSGEGPHEWHTSLQPWEGEQIDALLLVGASFDTHGRPAALRWLVHQLAAPLLLDANESVDYLTQPVLREREVGH